MGILLLVNRLPTIVMLWPERPTEVRPWFATIVIRLTAGQTPGSWQRFTAVVVRLAAGQANYAWHRFGAVIVGASREQWIGTARSFKALYGPSILVTGQC